MYLFVSFWNSPGGALSEPQITEELCFRLDPKRFSARDAKRDLRREPIESQVLLVALKKNVVRVGCCGGFPIWTTLPSFIHLCCVPCTRPRLVSRMGEHSLSQMTSEQVMQGSGRGEEESRGSGLCRFKVSTGAFFRCNVVWFP